jgi:hypothetical protein
LLAHGNVAQIARKVDRVVLNATISTASEKLITFAHDHSAA